MKASVGLAFFKVKSYHFEAIMIHIVSVKCQLRYCNDVISYHKLKPITAVVNVSLNRCPKLTVLQDFQ